MQALWKIQLTNEQVDMLKAGEVVELPASWEEFEDFLTETNYRIDYHDEKIIAIGLAKLIHEFLVIRLGYLLTGFIWESPFTWQAARRASVKTENGGITMAMYWSLKANQYFRINPVPLVPIHTCLSKSFPNQRLIMI